MANQDVTWEVSTKYNVGIETGFFNELKINADFFYERRENIFLAPQFSEISGLPKDYTNYANMGLMENRGFEVSPNTSSVSAKTSPSPFAETSPLPATR